MYCTPICSFCKSHFFVITKVNKGIDEARKRRSRGERRKKKKIINVRNCYFYQCTLKPSYPLNGKQKQINDNVIDIVIMLPIKKKKRTMITLFKMKEKKNIQEKKEREKERKNNVITFKVPMLNDDVETSNKCVRVVYLVCVGSKEEE